MTPIAIDEDGLSDTLWVRLGGRLSGRIRGIYYDGPLLWDIYGMTVAHGSDSNESDT